MHGIAQRRLAARVACLAAACLLHAAPPAAAAESNQLGLQAGARRLQAASKTASAQSRLCSYEQERCTRQFGKQQAAAGSAAMAHELQMVGMENSGKHFRIV